MRKSTKGTKLNGNTKKVSSRLISVFSIFLVLSLILGGLPGSELSGQVVNGQDIAGENTGGAASGDDIIVEGGGTDATGNTAGTPDSGSDNAGAAGAGAGASGAEANGGLGGVSGDGLNDPFGDPPMGDPADPPKYMVKFLSPDGALLSGVYVKSGEVVDAVSIPAITSQYFLGWGESPDSEVFFDLTSPITREITLYAVYEPQPLYHLITFVVGGTVYHKETVLHDTLVQLPADPPARNGQQFIGWFTEWGTPLTKYNLVSDNNVYYARFSNTQAVVTYLDIDGTVLQAVVGEIGQPAPGPGRDLTLPLGTQFLGWALEGTQVPFEDDLTESITLVPLYAGVNMAVFVTNGTEVEPQTGSAGFEATRPVTNPKRDGYTFDGWSPNENGTGYFDFAGSAIFGTVFIYARWIPAETNYTVNIWVEKPNIDLPGDPLTNGRGDYEVHFTTTQTGITGDVVTFDEAGARGLIPDSATEVKNLTTYSDFRASETQTLSPNGDTVINIFFTRMVFTYNFDVTAYNGKIYLENGNEAGTDGYYTIHVKLDQNLVNIWPARVEFGTGHTNKNFINWSGFYGMSPLKVSYLYISVAFTQATGGIVSGNTQIVTPKRTEVTLIPSVKIGNVYSEIRRYFVELTDAELAEYKANGSLGSVEVIAWDSGDHAIYGGVRYYKFLYQAGKNNQAGSPDPGPGNTGGARGWPGLETDGFEPIGAWNSTKHVCKSQQFQDVYRVDPNNSWDYYIDYFMPRKSYTLTLVSGNGTILDTGDFTGAGGIYNQVLKYEETISDLLPNQVSRPNFIFLGWYMDEDLTIPYDGSIMPAYNITLYAKYQGTEVTVMYHDGNSVFKTTTYATGEKLMLHDLVGTDYEGVQVGDVVPGMGVFDGWYYDVGTDVIASVEFPLGLPLDRDYYVLNAAFHPEIYQVKFTDELWNIDYGTKEVISGTNNTIAKSGHLMPTVPEREGYKFKGWTTTQGGMTANFTGATPIKSSVEVFAIWEKIMIKVTFNGNGGRVLVTNSHLIDYKFSLDTAGITLPTVAEVDRMYYMFVGWFTAPTGGQPFDVTKELTKNTVVYAQWKTHLVPNEPGPLPGGPSTPDDPTLPSMPDTSEIKGVKVPLGGVAVFNTWSLLSLLMSVVGVIVSIALLASMIKRKKDLYDEEERAADKTGRLEELEEEEKKKRKKISRTKIFAVLAAIVTAILFLILDDLTLPMAWINKWTLFVAIPFVIHVVTLIVLFVKNRKHNDDDEDNKNKANVFSMSPAK